MIPALLTGETFLKTPLVISVVLETSGDGGGGGGGERAKHF